jgi:hypothetical protein
LPWVRAERFAGLRLRRYSRFRYAAKSLFNRVFVLFFRYIFKLIIDRSEMLFEPPKRGLSNLVAWGCVDTSYARTPIDS